MSLSLLILATLAAGEPRVTVTAPSEPTDMRTIVLSVTRSQVSTEAGMALLRKRVDAALRDACGVYSATPYHEWQSVDDCRRRASADVETQLALLRQNQAAKLVLNIR